MTFPSKRTFRDSTEENYYQERLAEIINDGRLDDEEAEQSAWASVLLRRQYEKLADDPVM